jgi:hypothetical protein
MVPYQVLQTVISYIAVGVPELGMDRDACVQPALMWFSKKNSVPSHSVCYNT